MGARWYKPLWLSKYFLNKVSQHVIQSYNGYTHSGLCAKDTECRRLKLAGVGGGGGGETCEYANITTDSNVSRGNGATEW